MFLCAPPCSCILFCVVMSYSAVGPIGFLRGTDIVCFSKVHVADNWCALFNKERTVSVTVWKPSHSG